MRTSLILIMALALLSCSGTDLPYETSYDEIGPAMQRIRGVLYESHPTGLPKDFSGEDYKQSIRTDATMYPLIQQFTFKVESIGEHYRVDVYDGDKLLIVDFSCTTKIDYSLYRGSITPDDVLSPCK